MLDHNLFSMEKYSVIFSVHFKAFHNFSLQRLSSLIGREQLSGSVAFGGGSFSVSSDLLAHQPCPSEETFKHAN